MSNLIGRLLRRERAPEGDLATGDWSPVPLTAIARPADLVTWLSEEVVGRPKATAPEAVKFTPEELAIIEEQRRARTPVLASHSAALDGAAEPPAPLSPAAEPSPGRPSWVEILKSYAEHLTDAELHILRQQLQG